jgi:uncharacterized phiE125 gp8 family phage protein
MAVPITLADVGHQLRLTDDEVTSRQVELQGFIDDAAAWVEDYTGHILVAREVTETFYGFKPATLRAWPVKSDAPIGVAYTDAAGVPTSIPGARLQVSRRRARVLPASGSFFPFRDAGQMFTVTLRAGYEPSDPVPGSFRRAMLVLIGAYDADREGGEVFALAANAAKSLCRSFRARQL